MLSTLPFRPGLQLDVFGMTDAVERGTLQLAGRLAVDEGGGPE